MKRYSGPLTGGIFVNHMAAALARQSESGLFQNTDDIAQLAVAGGSSHRYFQSRKANGYPVKNGFSVSDTILDVNF